MAISEIELEKKFLIKNLSVFWHMLQDVSKARKLGGYSPSGCTSKSRAYRYFDTFAGDLQRDHSGIAYFAQGESRLPFINRQQQERLIRGKLEEAGASVSTRQREELADCVLTVKIPTGQPNERGDYNHPLPDANFYTIDPNTFDHWDPLRQIRDRIGNLPLQEVVRLYVQTHRFNLYHSPRKIKRNLRLEIALDFVTGISYLSEQVMFQELEIERKGEGEEKDVDAVREFFMKRYAHSMTEAPNPKWIKAMGLLRSEMAPYGARLG